MLAFLDKITFGTPLLRRIAFWLLTTFLLYVIAGFFILPPVMKKIIVAESEEALGRATTIERIAFNPLTLHFEVDGLRIAKREGDGNLVFVDSFKVAPGLASIWKLAPVISYLQLRNLAVDITFFGDGRYSISDLIGSRQEEGPTKEATTAEEDEKGAIFPFALYGFEMTNATIVVDDREFDKKHVVSELDLIVPFTSSFQDLRKEFTQPVFRAVINGDPLELQGRTLPFDDSLLTEFQLGAMDVDLHQYWRYLPIETPLQLVNGRFSSDLSLFFERPDAQRVKLFLGGGGSLNDLELAAPGEGTVVSLKELNFQMEKYSLGDNALSLRRIIFDHPRFKVVRGKDNTINWATYFPGSEITSEGAKVQTKDTDSDLLIDIQAVEVREGSLKWLDHAVPGGFKHDFKHFALKGENISTHGDQPFTFNVTIGKSGQTFAVNGKSTITPVRGSARITGKSIQLPTYRPYLDEILPMAVNNGLVSFASDVSFDLSGKEPVITAGNCSLTLEMLAMHKPGEEKPSISLDKFAVSGTTVHPGKQTVTVADVQIAAPSVHLIREKTGTLDLAHLFAREQEKEVVQEAEQAAEPWTVTVEKVHVKDGETVYKDMTRKHPATFSLDAITADLGNITTKKGETATYSIATRWAKQGEISVDGTVMLDPLKADGTLRIKSMALRPFDGHLAEFTELLFASGTASTDLKYTFSGGDTPKFSVTGNAQLSRLHLKDNLGDGEFAGIKALKLAGIRFSNEPWRLSLANIHLDGPHASVDFDENGHLNIRRALRIPEPPPAPKDNESDKAGEKTGTPAQTTIEELPEHESEPSLFKSLGIGKVTMENGRVRFRDATVSPPYVTTISDMKLGLVEIAMSEDARPKLSFSARIGPTPMSVTGALNPVVTPIYSDLSISVTGLELVPLSPYTVQHLGYPIEKGRLYADVKFKTEDWVLDARNKFFIEQLVLGPKDKRPNTPNVPVKFGLSLLQDGKGNVEINLPIKGRLDDPNFHIGGIVFKTIASLFVKALASPFSLIGSIFGGNGQNMDFVVFEPGHHQLDVAGLQKLETTIKALGQRKRLSLEVDGVIDPVADRQGLVEVIFEDKLKQQKYNSLSRKERSETTVEAMVIAPEEYEDILFEVYADEPDEEGIKPTTLFMTDRQPVETMEEFIIERIKVTDDDLNALALRRAEAVKAHIIGRDSSLTKRVFLLDQRKARKGKTGVPQHRVDLGIK